MKTLAFADIWAYLAATPLFGLCLTLGAFALARELARRSGNHPLANPVLLAAAGVAAILALAGLPYRSYFEGAQFVHFLLGPATIALGVPLARRTPALRRQLGPIAAGIGAGALVATLSALALADFFGSDAVTLRSLAPKSVTAPIAMGIAERIGGLPSLAAGIVIITGIVGAVAGMPLLRLLGISDRRIQGIALGTSAHGIGTARAFQLDAEAGAYAGLAMAINGALLAILIPLLALIL